MRPYFAALAVFALAAPPALAAPYPELAAEAERLKAEIETALAADGQGDVALVADLEALADATQAASDNEEESDLRCIMRGIAEDLTLKGARLTAEADDRKILRDLVYLLDDKAALLR